MPSAPSAGFGPGAQAAVAWPLDGAAAAVRRAVLAGQAPAPVADVYRTHRYRPLWVSHGRLRPEAAELVARLEQAAADGLDPNTYDPGRLQALIAAARPGDTRALARAELALSVAYAAYISDLHRPPPGAQAAWRDPALPPTLADPRHALEAAAAAPDLGLALAAATRMHPIYEALRTQLALRRSAPSAAGRSEGLILANMARARALPADPGPRYILVDPAAQRMWLYEDGQVVDSMRAIVGTAGDQTPTMAGLMRYARYRPYWNVPEDIVREEIAPHVLREGPSYLAREDMEILADWSPDARVVDPADVDWRAVASGATTLRMRRLPGEQNILGQVKLMLPNPLGIYLHDTPAKWMFGRSQRTLSHGCIRLEDAPRLARHLIGPAADNPPAGDDVRVDLPKPVPVYVVYFTLAPTPQGLEARRDVYHRDAPLIAELTGRERAVAD